MVAILKKREDSILFQKTPICALPASKSKFQCPKHNARGLKRTSQRLDRRLEIFQSCFCLAVVFVVTGRNEQISIVQTQSRCTCDVGQTVSSQGSANFTPRKSNTQSNSHVVFVVMESISTQPNFENSSKESIVLSTPNLKKKSRQLHQVRPKRR